MSSPRGSRGRSWGSPFSAARLAPFLNDVEAARTAPLLTRADFAGTPLATALDALLDVQAADADRLPAR